MNDIPLGTLFAILVALIVLSACFSGSETGMMALNRYRLRHLTRIGHRGARLASRLLERPDRLIGLILLGNNFVNVLATMVTTVIAWRLYGDAGLLPASILITVVFLIFAEVTPKTAAALHAEKVAFPASIVLAPLLRVLLPIVIALNWMSNGILRLFRIQVERADHQDLSRDELRSVVYEAGALIPRRHRNMLVSILDLEKVVVDDIMIPRSEIAGVDLEDDMDDIVEQLTLSRHSRLPVYRGDINEVVGMLHLRRLVRHFEQEELTKETLTAAASEPYFVPAGTPLNTQLLNFQRAEARIGLVVDEYGDIDGLVTLEDLLEEIVGEFTTDPVKHEVDVHPQNDGTFL
ncbi:MAG: HlyC/CorC family transporter, partial [Gammaproteobacteria bacterium]